MKKPYLEYRARVPVPARMKGPIRGLRKSAITNYFIIGHGHNNHILRLPEFKGTGSTKPKQKPQTNYPCVHPATDLKERNSIVAARIGTKKTYQLNN